MSFEGKICVITGGARGMGRATGEQFMREGCAIAVLDIDDSLRAEVTEGFRKIGGRFHYGVCDVSDQESVDRAIEAAVAELGGVDFLINCAAKHLSFYAKPPTQLPRDHWKLLLEINVIGIVNTAAACRPHMAKRGGGVIVNFSSMAGFNVIGSYGVSKLAVRGLTNALAAEFGPDNIRVNGVAPGLVDSPMAVEDISDTIRDRLLAAQTIKRLGRMDDVINAVRFFCSDQSSFVSGETLLVAGGYPLRP